MSILKILIYPDPGLKKIANVVSEFDQNLKDIVNDMFETMYNSNGVGLAAIQVGIQKRIFTMDVSDNKSQKIAFINPEIMEAEEIGINEEGCLSFPGVYAKVKRAQKIKVKYLDISGRENIQEFEGLAAICVQHEIDHLNGITFFDHISHLKRTLLEKKLEKVLKTSTY